MTEKSQDSAPPLYEHEANHIYSEWKKAIEAASELDVLGPELAAAQKQLNALNLTLKDLKEKSTAAFQARHRKKGVLSSLLPGIRRFSHQKKPSNTESTADGQLNSHEADEEFNRAKEEEDTQAESMARLSERVSTLSKKKDALDGLAKSNEALWSSLCSVQDSASGLDDVGSRSNDINLLIEEVDIADSAFREESKTLADFSRAQLAGSNAHLYLANVLKVCDANNLGGAASVVAEGFRDFTVNAWKQNSLTQASGEGKKAQVCLDEAFRVLEPHVSAMPEDCAHDYDELRRSGVLQISKIYDLLYQGDTHANSVRPLVKTLLERQEAAFASLTRLAVWIQERVPHYEAEERRARARRDAARKKLADLWFGTSAAASLSR